MMDSILTNICVLSPFICCILIGVCVSQDRKIDKLKADLSLQNIPEIIKIKQEQNALEQQKIKADITKTNLEIEKMIRNGNFHIKVPKRDLSNCLKGAGNGYVYLRFANHQLEILPNGTSKITINASWEKLERYL